MIQKPTIHTLLSTAWAVAILDPAAGRAQPANMMTMMPTLRGGETNRPSLVQAALETSYTASSRAKFFGTKSGDSDAFSASLNLFAPLPLNGQWILPLGLGSQNILLDSVPGAPVPGQMHTLSFTTGIGHRLNDDWMIMGMFSPTLYKLSDVGGNDLGFAGGINAVWRYSPSLMFTFGVMASPDSDIPVLPMVGADWCINEKFEFRLLFPQPRLIYQPEPRWSFHVGANLAGATFRSSDRLGTSIGLPQYNDALGTYRDIRIGAGVGRQFTTSIRVEAEAGYSMSRQIDYTTVHETVKFDPAPYVRLGVNVSF